MLNSKNGEELNQSMGWRRRFVPDGCNILKQSTHDIISRPTPSTSFFEQLSSLPEVGVNVLQLFRLDLDKQTFMAQYGANAAGTPNVQADTPKIPKYGSNVQATINKPSHFYNDERWLLLSRDASGVYTSKIDCQRTPNGAKGNPDNPILTGRTDPKPEHYK